MGFVVVALAAAPMLRERYAAFDLGPPPAVLITGSTHSAPNSVEASADGGGLSAAVPAMALPAESASDTIQVSALSTDAFPKDLMTISRNGDRIEIVGAIARLEKHELLIAKSEKAFPTFAIDARLVQEANLNEDRDKAALVAIAALSRLAEGRAEISENTISVTGRALYAQIPAILAARLADEVPAGWTVSLEIDAPEGAAANGGAQCQQGIVERLAEDQISFAVAAASLAPDAEPLLDKLAEILGQCPNVAVEVAGHTDSDGSEAANRRLSQERAAAVRQALSERGVEAERLSAVGYGQAQPIAPNDTPENKARNRRIELIVIE